ncbi:hypothetical protein N5E99_07330 [Pseudomonas chengduensis]|jgi:ABC-type spermidine/putrescine transport system permease subunit II|uniref:Uncharacterized protein n=2 Tax=Pseudomonadaceae TaxID=135621 RepID=A0A1H2ND56_9PSED|nr:MULTISPECIES: hypothetical protein [Pseudomonas]KQO43786.1 hypothetical protein ASF15_00605 [Pseudomonas sp. Leaf83]MBP3061487.1 hypothetical protein [Pseudomonas chengduensis]MDH0958352.1 hypothetical protein [Pseudomonas chengduensis]MDH1535564.1 hypothetical protein [Pseudomonas chengduensis]MDH1623443.1 hypothetical protein [Pseudomonas chengduensis]
MFSVLILGFFFLLLGIGVGVSVFLDISSGSVYIAGHRGSPSAWYNAEHNPEEFASAIQLSIGFASVSAIIGLVLIAVAVRMAFPKRKQYRWLI